MPNDFPDWQRPQGFPVKLGEITVAANATASVTITIPFGTLAAGFLVDFSGAGANPTRVTVTGVQSNTVYLNVANPTGGGPHVAMLAGIDTSVTLSATSPIVASTHTWLIGWTSQPVVALNPNIEAPVPVTFFSAANPVLNAQPSPWQSPGAGPGFQFAAVVGAGATVNIVPALVGNRTYLWVLWGEIDTTPVGSSVNLEDTGLTLLGFFAGGTKGPWVLPLFGLKTSLGAGVQWRNTSAVATGGLNGALVALQSTA